MAHEEDLHAAGLPFPADLDTRLPLVLPESERVLPLYLEEAVADLGRCGDRGGRGHRDRQQPRSRVTFDAHVSLLH